MDERNPRKAIDQGASQDIANQMPHGSALDFSSARVTLVSALAWRVVAELFRRYQRQIDLRVLEVHPGISVRGALYVTARSRNGERAAALSLNLGGPSGTYRVIQRVDGLPLGPDGSSDVEFAGPMLNMDPIAVVEQIAAAWGLPRSVGRIPPSTPSTIVARTIAGLLETLVFRRENWRTTAGFCDNSAVGPIVPDWTGALGVSETTIRQAANGRDLNDADFLTRYVLLHRCNGDSMCLRLDDLEGSAWAFCMASGAAVRLTSQGADRTVKLPLRFQELDRDCSALVGEMRYALD